METNEGSVGHVIGEMAVGDGKMLVCAFVVVALVAW
jgi:hypothetical protein